MRKNSEQRVINLMSCAQRELRQSGVLLIFGELRLELHFFAIQFALLIKAAEEFLLDGVALPVAFLRALIRCLDLLREPARLVGVVKPGDHQADNQYQDASSPENRASGGEACQQYSGAAETTRTGEGHQHVCLA
jgi:hypothetical protein